MQFKDDEERAAVANALCSSTPDLRNLWMPGRPTKEYLDLVRDAGEPKSSGERILLYVSLAIWGRLDLWPPDRAFTLEDMFYRLDGTRRRMIGELLVATATRGALATWLARYGEEWGH